MNDGEEPESNRAISAGGQRVGDPGNSALNSEDSDEDMQSKVFDGVIDIDDEIDESILHMNNRPGSLETNLGGREYSSSMHPFIKSLKG